MSKSVKISKPVKLVSQQEVVHDISDKLKVSEQMVRAVINSFAERISTELQNGNAVSFARICTFHLRRRDYSPERRASFHMAAKATLPEFCYYPYANMSTLLKQSIAKVKDKIDIIHKNNNN